MTKNPNIRNILGEGHLIKLRIFQPPHHFSPYFHGVITSFSKITKHSAKISIYESMSHNKKHEQKKHYTKFFIYNNFGITPSDDVTRYSQHSPCNTVISVPLFEYFFEIKINFGKKFIKITFCNIVLFKH